MTKTGLVGYLLIALSFYSDIAPAQDSLNKVPPTDEELSRALDQNRLERRDQVLISQLKQMRFREHRLLSKIIVDNPTIANSMVTSSLRRDSTSARTILRVVTSEGLRCQIESGYEEGGNFVITYYDYGSIKCIDSDSNFVVQREYNRSDLVRIRGSFDLQDLPSLTAFGHYRESR